MTAFVEDGDADFNWLDHGQIQYADPALRLTGAAGNTAGELDSVGVTNAPTSSGQAYDGNGEEPTDLNLRMFSTRSRGKLT